MNIQKSDFACSSRALGSHSSLISILGYKELHHPFIYLGALRVKGRVNCICVQWSTKQVTSVVVSLEF